MAGNLSHLSKRWRNRLIVSLAFSPALAIATQFFNSTSASAEELVAPSEEGGTSDSSSTTDSSTNENASEEVVLEAPSPESTQGSIDEVATAVATAESEITNVEQEIQETKDLESTIEPTEETAQSIAQAEEAAVSASVARDSASSAVEEASTAVGEWEASIHESDTADANKVIAEEVLVIEEVEHEEAVTNRQNQEVVVDEAESAKNSAESDLQYAEENVNETVVESFKDEDGNLSESTTDIEITKDGEPVTKTDNDRTSVTNNQYLDGSVLTLKGPAKNTVIDFPTIKQISEVGMTVYAKNGDAEATVDIYDSEGTSTSDIWTIKDNVNPDYPDYTSYEVYKTPEGFFVDKVTLPEDPYDWYIIDDIYYKTTGEVDPSFYKDVETTTNTYQTEKEVLDELVVVEDEKLADVEVATTNFVEAEQTAIDAETTEQEKAIIAEDAVQTMNQSVSVMNDSVEIAKSYSASAKNVVEQEVVNQTPEPEPEPEPTPSPPEPEPTPTPAPEPEPELEQPEAEEPETPQPTPENGEEEEASPEDSSPDTEELPQPTPPEPDEPEPTPEPLPAPSDEDSETSQPEKPEPQSPTESEPEMESESEKLQTPSEAPSVLDNPDSSIEEKVEAIIETLESGTSVNAEVLVDNGITFDDLPPETLVSVREDEDGNEVVIDAKTAAALLVLESPIEFVTTAFENPAKAVEAVMSIGKDMSEEEREESQKVVVAAVIVSNIANLAVQAANNAVIALPGSGRRRM